MIHYVEHSTKLAKRSLSTQDGYIGDRDLDRRFSVVVPITKLNLTLLKNKSILPKQRLDILPKINPHILPSRFEHFED